MSGCSWPQNNNSRHLQIHKSMSASLGPGANFSVDRDVLFWSSSAHPSFPTHSMVCTKPPWPHWTCHKSLFPCSGHKKNRGAEIPCHRSSSENEAWSAKSGQLRSGFLSFWASYVPLKLPLASYISRHRTTANNFRWTSISFAFKSKRLYKFSSQSRHMFDTWIDIEIVWNSIGIEWIQTYWVPMVPHCPTCPRYPIQSPSKTRETLLGVCWIMREFCFPDT